MSGKPQKGSLRTAVLEAVRRLGECDVPALVRALGPAISVEMAESYHRTEVRVEAKRRKGSPPRIKSVSPAQRGANKIVTNVLVRLAREGKIKRVSPGVYSSGDMTLRELILATVLSSVECSLASVAASVGKKIPASRAAAAYRRQQKYDAKRGRPRETNLCDKADMGRRQVVGAVLLELEKAGKIRRVRRGVYAPPLPKLFEAV